MADFIQADIAVLWVLSGTCLVAGLVILWRAYSRRRRMGNAPEARSLWSRIDRIVGMVLLIFAALFANLVRIFGS